MKKFIFIAVLALNVLSWGHLTRADIKDPLDPFDSTVWPSIDQESDEQKSPEQLIAEAGVLLEDERPLDARTKLLRALQKDPNQYKAHLMLAAYYMVHVGHFRLALKYVKQGHALFEKLHGRPPYVDFVRQSEHAHILYLLSQARLNLDNYHGALEVLEEFTSYGYYADWFAGTKAWILMKLGRIDEAIQVARMGVLIEGGEFGRTLNMLGILLSMRGERQSSVEIFKKAISYELALGSLGQPATPLNNIGEVYREIFSEDLAQSAWLRATSLPDGCDHVLPSLNLAQSYLDELNIDGAKRAMDSFQACIAQFPLKNGEEHRALVNLARGRIDLLTGNVDSSVKRIAAGLEHQQWFGKIGTNIDDLRAGAMLSLAQSLQARSNVRKSYHRSSYWEMVADLKANTTDTLRSWWYFRRARQILIEDLNLLEDVYVRNTDSLLDYATLGEILADVPTSVLKDKLSRERNADSREEARPYYDCYLAESYLRHGHRREADALLDGVLLQARYRYDSALRLHALLLKLELLDQRGPDYVSVSYDIFSLSRAALRNYGFRMPVRVEKGSAELLRLLADSPFVPYEGDLEYEVAYEYKDGEHHFRFSPLSTARSNAIGTITVKSVSLDEALNRLNDEVFERKR